MKVAHLNLKKKIKMKLIKNLDGVNKIWRKQYNHNKYRLWWKQRCKINLFLDKIHKSLLFIVDEREDIQKRSFTKWINSQLSKVRLKTSKSNSDITRSTWGCKNELWQILYYNSGRKYSIISNIGNCHLFWWIISDYLVILEVVREMKIYNLGLI